MTQTESRLFTITREADATGISGTGRVLDGVVFHTGQVVVCWRSSFGSITVFDNWEAFDAVHLKAHPDNRARVTFLDQQPPVDGQQRADPAQGS